jgi:DNA repair exonuclease SbcCD nuclease subunit
MVRFLHTSDWQMGMRAAHAGVKAKEVRDTRFDSALRVANLAKKHQVDFVIIAGDVFEHHDVDEVVVKRTVDILNQFAPITVYVLPGNHDPYVPGGVWDRQSWRRVESHVILCTEPKELEFGDSVAIYPCPLMQKRSTLDPTSWIPQRSGDDTRIRIGIAHGALDLLPDTVNFPISKERPELSGLDYLALGDWHSPLQHGRAAYSGTMEPTSFSERDPGYAALVEILSSGEEPKLSRQQTRILTWSEFNPTIRDIVDVESLDSAIKGLGSLNSLLLRIEPLIDAEVGEEVVQRLQVLKEELEERSFLLEWHDEPSTLANLDLARRLPDGILQRVDEALSTILEGRIPEDPAHSFAGEERTVVQEARTMLYRLAHREPR